MQKSFIEKRFDVPVRFPYSINFIMIWISFMNLIFVVAFLPCVKNHLRVLLSSHSIATIVVIAAIAIAIVVIFFTVWSILVLSILKKNAWLIKSHDRVDSSKTFSYIFPAILAILAILAGRLFFLGEELIGLRSNLIACALYLLFIPATKKYVIENKLWRLKSIYLAFSIFVVASIAYFQAILHVYSNSKMLQNIWNELFRATIGAIPITAISGQPFIPVSMTLFLGCTLLLKQSKTKLYELWNPFTMSELNLSTNALLPTLWLMTGIIYGSVVAAYRFTFMLTIGLFCFQLSILLYLNTMSAKQLRNMIVLNIIERMEEYSDICRPFSIGDIRVTCSENKDYLVTNESDEVCISSTTGWSESVRSNSESIKIILSKKVAGKEAEIETIIVDENSMIEGKKTPWAWKSSKDLPKYENGTEITYIIEQESPSLHQPQVYKEKYRKIFNKLSVLLLQPFINAGTTDMISSRRHLFAAIQTLADRFIQDWNKETTSSDSQNKDVSSSFCLYALTVGLAALPDYSMKNVHGVTKEEYMVNIITEIDDIIDKIINNKNSSGRGFGDKYKEDYILFYKYVIMAIVLKYMYYDYKKAEKKPSDFSDELVNIIRERTKKDTTLFSSFVSVAKLIIPIGESDFFTKYLNEQGSSQENPLDEIKMQIFKNGNGLIVDAKHITPTRSGFKISKLTQRKSEIKTSSKIK